MLWQSTCEIVQNTFEISIRAVLSCFPIILREADLENVSSSVRLKSWVCLLTADYKYPFQFWENLPLALQMQLLEKWKTFSVFFFHIWILHQYLNILKKKDDRHS